MKYIRNYKVFENNTDLTQEQIDFLDNCTRKTWNKPYAYPQPYSTERPADYLQGVYRLKNPNRTWNRTWEVNPNTGLIDVQGSFDCSHMNLNDFKGLRFGKVSGRFSCKYNKLKTLDGSPREVGEVFSCFDNPLTSLEGAPLVVRDQFEVRGASIRYNLDAFLEEIKKTDRRFYTLTIRLPGFNELLLTHHFFTPEVIKQKIKEDDDFLINLLKVWNTPQFKKKQDELTSALPPEIIQKMNDLWVEKIKEDDNFCKSFCEYWNTPEFKTKQDELTRTLHPEILQKIKDYSAVVGYL